MKLSCKVIEDILPLYHDNVCSDETRILTEEHLRECARCRGLLAEMNKEFSLPEEQLDDLRPLKGIRSEWIRIRKRTLLYSILSIAATAAVIIGGWWLLTQWKWIPVPSEKISVTGLSQLRDGEIAFNFLVDDGKEVTTIRYKTDEEASVLYLIPKRSVIEAQCFTDPTGERIYRSLNGKNFYMELNPFTKAQYRDPSYEEEITAYYEQNPSSADISIYGEIDTVCVGTERDHIVLWQRGDNLPAASEEFQEKYDNGWR